MRYNNYMVAKNKWNGKLYTVLSMPVNKVELQRSDGSEFKIQKSEFYFSYIIIGKRGTK